MLKGRNTDQVCQELKGSYMTKENMIPLITVKMICCAALLFFFFGGLGLLSGMSTGNIILTVLGLGLLIWGFFLYFRKKRHHCSNGEEQ